MLRRFLIAACMALGLGFLPLSIALPSHVQNAVLIAPTAPPRPPEVRHYLRPVPLTAATTVLAYPAPPVMARAAMLVDLDDGKVLYSKNPDEPLPMASTTKITTAAVVLQHAHLSAMVRTSRAAATIGESTMSLRQGEVLSVKDLLYGMLLNSGNDAAIALAEYVGGTQARFVGMMNALARELHMRHTHYATPHGLDAPGHYTSARDLATITMYALRDPTFRRIVRTEYYHIPKTKHNFEHYLGNINKALYWYPGVDGVKPGDTDRAGLCLVVSARRNGHHVLAVLLHTPNLVTDLRNLLNMGTRDFAWVPSIFAIDQPASSLSGGTGTGAWTYYFGAGHYIRGRFLTYFRSRGGLNALGYPRTEQITEHGRAVQYFQGGELELNPNGKVAALPLGRTLARRVIRAHLEDAAAVAAPLRSYYHRLAGGRVLGAPVTALVTDGDLPAQFFRYGEVALPSGGPTLVPVGDAALRLKGWLPASGAADSFPPSMTPNLELRYAPPAPKKGTHHAIIHSRKHRTAARATHR
jgi:D-alanyl-D-alanine carboxypeptidase